MYQKQSIAILICYMGKLPWYFDYFVHSCLYNPTIDFFIITDNLTYHKPLPDHVKFIYKTLDDISTIATLKLGFAIHIKHAYKLCDFKPTYGLLFPELIKGYDFWGYGDIDVVFGNIRNFMTDDVLTHYDIISVRHDFLTGYFQLLKNNEKMNTLFTHSKDYKKVLSSHKHYCFDETNFQHEAFTEEKPLHQIKCEIESMMHVVRKMEKKNYIKAYFDFHVIEGVPGRLKWINGKLFYRNKFEIILYHLIIFKSIYKPKRDIKTIPEVFTISRSKIYHK